jgi:hypothetical protein
MSKDKKQHPDRWPPVRRPASTWWLLAKGKNFGAGALIADCGGERALAVFSGEDEAEMFAWLGGAFEDGWRVRATSPGELVSIIYGPLAGVKRVALDPSPEMAPETIRLVSLSRERFVSWIVDSPLPPGASGRHHARWLVGSL